MADALSIAADLGFFASYQEDIQRLSTCSCEKGDDLIRILIELTVVQRKIANLQMELQGRKEDKNVANSTHTDEMVKKIDTLARIIAISKDRIITRIQRPYSLDCNPVEAEYQKQFSELLMNVAGDYGALTVSMVDFQWSQNFKKSPTVWGLNEMLRPVPVALASFTRFFEAVTAMREAFTELQTLRVGHSSQEINYTI